MKYWISGLLIVVVGAIALYYSGWFGTGEAPSTETGTPVMAEQPARIEEQAESRPVPELEPALEKRMPAAQELEEIPLPPLSESDSLVLESLSDVFGPAEVQRYFVGEDVAARAVANIDALDSRQVPGSVQVLRGPQDSFRAVEDPAPPTVIRNEAGDPIPQYLSDPANDERYSAYVEMLESVDTETIVALYRKQYPLFEEAYRQLGYPDGDFEDRLKLVIDELLATPEVSGPVRYIKPEAFYLFADEELEALPAGQKMLIRMGSENAERVKAKLAEIREAL
jgi:hypothetical protein